MAYQKLNGRSPVLTRTDSLCPPPETILLEAVLRNETNTVEKTLQQNPELIRHIYEPEYNKPILAIAVCEEAVDPETVEILLKNGADTSFRCSIDDDWQAIHYAAQRTDSDVLKVVLDNLESPSEINDLANGNNALHVLVRHGHTDIEEELMKCAKLLIKYGINVNQPDGKDITPILWAAKRGLRSLIRVILEESVVPVDLDSHYIRNKTARDIIIENNLHEGFLPEKSDQTPSDSDILFKYVKAYNEDGFMAFIPENREDISSLVNSDNTESTLLQESCKRGLTRIVKYLIKNNADPNKITAKNEKYPIEIAAERGFYEILETLLQQPDIKIPRNILTEILKRIDGKKSVGINYEECYKIVIDKLRKNASSFDINAGDDFKNTPLHFAIRYGDQNSVEDVLKLGASLGAKNRFGYMPIQDIEPQLLEKHLDDCVKFDLKSKMMEKQEFTVTFNYRTLIPPCSEPESDVEAGGTHHGDLVPETEVIEYMSKAPEFKHLLKHPVIVSFLFMKWHRIRWLFYSNLTFYVVFFSSLVGYIFSHYADFGDDRTKLQNILSGVCWFLFLVTFFFLVLRELFQIAVTPSKYFTNFENYIEIILIFTSGAILFIPEPSVDSKKQLASISLLLAAFELVLMVGQHPKLSTNVVMLRTVSINFFKFLLWYSVLILAFAMSFYILFTDVNQDKTNTTSSDDEEDSFHDPGKSVFKTIVMLTGEFDASSINFQTFPITSKIIFSLFIFMIAIILLNLLNGLAVSDTQMIKNDAELVGHIARAQHIRYVESMLLGNVLPTNFLNWTNRICCCIPTNDLNFVAARPLAERACLFPRYLNYELTMYPNRSGQIGLPETKIRNKKCPTKACKYTYLDRQTIKRTTEIINKRREECKATQEEDIVKKIELLEEKLDSILRQIRKD